ncbi:hypothetical protein TNCV_3484191 [Trichonephila clavipes]|nr:hypothetical protein TNCV_3484191 [Trichonephila clavipes]
MPKEEELTQKRLQQWSLRTPRSPRYYSGGPWKIKIGLGVPEESARGPRKQSSGHGSVVVKVTGSLLGTAMSSRLVTLRPYCVEELKRRPRRVRDQKYLKSINTSRKTDELTHNATSNRTYSDFHTEQWHQINAIWNADVIAALMNPLKPKQSMTECQRIPTQEIFVRKP